MKKLIIIAALAVFSLNGMAMTETNIQTPQTTCQKQCKDCKKHGEKKDCKKGGDCCKKKDAKKAGDCCKKQEGKCKDCKKHDGKHACKKECKK